MRVKDEHKAEAIFEAALKLIWKEGISGLTMSKLASAAGLATGTVYIYFKNKETLLRELYLKLRQESLDRFLEGYNHDEEFLKCFRRIWMNYLKHRMEHHEASVFLEQYYRSPYISKDHLEMAEGMKEPVKRMIQRGKEDGLVRQDRDNEMLFLSMLGFIRELADEHVSGVYELNKQRIEQAFELSWDTIRQ